jgi:hypothetical protein
VLIRERCQLDRNSRRFLGCMRWNTRKCRSSASDNYAVVVTSFQDADLNWCDNFRSLHPEHQCGLGISSWEWTYGDCQGRISFVCPVTCQGSSIVQAISDSSPPANLGSIGCSWSMNWPPACTGPQTAFIVLNEIFD